MRFEKKEFYIDFFDKEYIKWHSYNKNKEEHFQLSFGDVGGNVEWDQDDREDIYTYQLLSCPSNFDVLVHDVQNFLNKGSSYGNHYSLKYSNSAEKRISNFEKGGLESVLSEHNKVYDELRGKRE